MCVCAHAFGCVGACKLQKSKLKVALANRKGWQQVGIMAQQCQVSGSVPYPYGFRMAPTAPDMKSL